MKKYIGIPYKDRGRNPETGLDCWGLAQYICLDYYNIELPRLRYEYKTAWELTEIALSFKRTLPMFKRLPQPEAGCLVSVSIYGVPCHVGVMVSDDAFIHTLAGSDSTMEKVSAKTWNRRIGQYYACL